MADGDNVEAFRVAVRIRPMVEKEIRNGCVPIVEVADGVPQVIVRGTEKSFTFNDVFDMESTQEQVYQNAALPMIENLFKGYNVTILAYGQTGSGKTYTMGTNYHDGDANMGIIPRMIHDIFQRINGDTNNTYGVTVSFLELYMEQLFDLMSTQQAVVDIREDPKSGICVPNLTEETITNVDQAIRALTNASQRRKVGATSMNQESSRSHAIFTVNVCRQPNADSDAPGFTSKLHLVDLAGSERSKKTQATGMRFAEGRDINMALMVLGKVISALGQENRATYVSYRESKLTRLLQDSLGGNSVTLMIACVSPVDYNLDETMSTLRYADQAKKIKNKPIVNEDNKASEIKRLKLYIQQLEDKYNKPSDNNNTRVRELELENERLRADKRTLAEQLEKTLHEQMALYERNMHSDCAKDITKKHLKEMQQFIESNADGSVQLIKDKLLMFEKELIAADEEMQHKGEFKAEDASMDHLSDDTHFDSERSEKISMQLEFREHFKQLSDALTVKERLCMELQADCQLDTHIKVVKENEDKIAALEREKDELSQQLRNVTHAPTASDTRKQRVQELERQINDLRKRISEQERIIKAKEKQQQKIDQLNREIVQIKQEKVKLMRVMRTESERFREWKLNRERELSKLKTQDRKLQNKIVQMEHIHAKQQQVLRRKFEEANAAKKRLLNALSSQKLSQDRRKAPGKKDNVAHRVADDIELLISTYEAEHSLKNLVETRAALKAQRDSLAALSQTDATLQQLSELDREMAIQSTQILELKQKINDSDADKHKWNWEAIKTVADFQLAAKCLFEYIGEQNKVKIQLEDDVSALNERVEAIAEEKEKVERLVAELKEKNGAFETEVKNVTTKSRVAKAMLPPVVVATFDDSVNESMEFDDNSEDDPDWYRSPIVRKMRRTTTARKRSHETSDRSQATASSSMTMKCMCKGGKCTHCKCARSNVTCTDLCTCTEFGKCVNKNDRQSNDAVVSTTTHDVDACDAPTLPKRIREIENNVNELNQTYSITSSKKVPLIPLVTPIKGKTSF